jgi:hypothetical protein
MALSKPLDLAHSQPTLDAAVARTQFELGVEVIVLAEVGPGGGWPLVQLKAAHWVLQWALMRGWGVPEAELAEWVA